MKINSMELHDTIVGIGIVLAFLTIMVGIAFLAGM